MRNLAGHKQATAYAAQELQAAGIPIEPFDPERREVQSQVCGRLGAFTFTRAWYYWVVEGPMPLEAAIALWDSSEVVRRDVRVAGHCACPHPAEWACWSAADGTPIQRDPDGSKEREWHGLCERHPDDFSLDEIVFAADPAQVEGARALIKNYHVDSQEGLNLLADAIRALQ